METFAVGTICTYTSDEFREGEEGMKCLNCPRVMTSDAWIEKRQCRCGSTNVVPAIASSSTSTASFHRERRNDPPRPINFPPQTTEPLPQTRQPVTSTSTPSFTSSTSTTSSPINRERRNESPRTRNVPPQTTEPLPQTRQAVASTSTPSFLNNNDPLVSRNFSMPRTESLHQRSQPRLSQAILYMIVVFITSFLAPTAYYKVFDSGNWNSLIDRIWQGHNLQLKKDWEDIWKNPFSL